MSEIRKKTILGLKVGDTFTIMRKFSEQNMLNFADITRDYNPIHFDNRFAQLKNLNGRICHGLLVGSMLTEIGGQIGWLASGMTFKFKKPVYFGDTIKCDFTITDIDVRGRAKAEAVFANQYDSTVLEAVITGIVPGAQDKQVMKDMLAEGDPTNKVR